VDDLQRVAAGLAVTGIGSIAQRFARAVVQHQNTRKLGLYWRRWADSAKASRFGEIERQLRMPQPTVSNHLRVLREAGFVECTVDAQRRLYRLRPEPLQEVDAWLAPFRRSWSAHVDALERHLDHVDQSAPTKRKARRRR
jgi:DNA-binding transcriptional ArsR family regulator